MHRSKMVFLAAVFAALWTPGASAEILSVSSSGAGGTTPLLAVVSYNSPNDGVEYNADFTSAAPISINFTVSPTASPATYLFGLPGAFTVTNDSGVGFSAFDVRLSTVLNIYGATLASASADPAIFPDRTFTSATEAYFSGAPGLLPGQSLFFAATFTLPGFGGDYQTVDLILTPVAAVPESSTWAMMLAGFAGLGWAGYRRARLNPR